MSRLSNPRAIQAERSPSDKFLSEFSKLHGVTSIQPCSDLTFAQIAFGYHLHAIQYNECHCTIILRSSEPNVVELDTLISYPDRKGGGRKTMERLCDIADSYGVTLWLDAYPFGRNRDHIPLKKLKAFYAQFGFFHWNNVNRRWVCGYHQFNRSDFKNVMVRQPEVADSSLEEIAEPAGTARLTDGGLTVTDRSKNTTSELD